MKKLLSFFLLSFTLFQSCTHDESDVAPVQLVTPGAINIESVIRKMNGFVLEDASAILLKSVDSDPTTHKTTLFYADSKGKITPVVENFEVRSVKVTTNGIYVLTNYNEGGSPIAFFVKYDNTWLQLKNAGDYIAEDGNGDILFANATLKTSGKLKVDITTGTTIAATSGNLMLLVKPNGDRRVVDTVTNIGHDVYACTNPFLESFYNNDIALVSDGGNSYEVLDMKTGTIEWVNYAAIYEPSRMVRTKDGITVLGKEWQPQSNPEHTPAELRLSHILFGYSNNGQVSYSVSYEAYTGQLLPVAYTLPAIDLSFLHLSQVNTYTFIDTLVFYSGIRNGQPVTGIYNKDTNQDMVVANDIFSSINPL